MGSLAGSERRPTRPHPPDPDRRSPKLLGATLAGLSVARRARSSRSRISRRAATTCLRRAGKPNKALMVLSRLALAPRVRPLARTKLTFITRPVNLAKLIITSRSALPLLSFRAGRNACADYKPPLWVIDLTAASICSPAKRPDRNWSPT